jgi:pyrimidine-specific ribonucleoside hydrolase
VVDTDMGADDILALAVLLSSGDVDVRAVTVAGTGLAHCSGGVRVLHGLLHQLGGGDIPIGCGREQPGAGARAFPEEWRAAADGGYGLGLPDASVGTPGGAVNVLADALVTAQSPVTIVELGPWTNLQDLFATRTDVVGRVAAIHAMGGTLDAPGNVMLDGSTPVEPSLEWNFAADPAAVAQVLPLGVPVRLVTLDATDQVPLSGEIYQELDASNGSAAANLAYELLTLNPYLWQGGTFLWDELAALALLDPDLVTWEDVALSIVQEGAGAGHLARVSAGPTARVSTGTEPALAVGAFLEALTAGDPRGEPFALDGEVRASWDGTRCLAEAANHGGAGVYRLRFDNQAVAFTGFAMIAVDAPHTWQQVRRVAATLDITAGEPPPDWISIIGQAQADAGQTAIGVVRLGSPLVGPVCAAADKVGAGPVYHVGDPLSPS